MQASFDVRQRSRFPRIVRHAGHFRDRLHASGGNLKARGAASRDITCAGQHADAIAGYRHRLGSPRERRVANFSRQFAVQRRGREALTEDPALLWKKSFKDGMFESTPAIETGVVYVGGLNGYFYALDLATGDEKWKFHSELGFRAGRCA